MRDHTPSSCVSGGRVAHLDGSLPASSSRSSPRRCGDRRRRAGAPTHGSGARGACARLHPKWRRRSSSIRRSARSSRDASTRSRRWRAEPDAPPSGSCFAARADVARGRLRGGARERSTELSQRDPLGDARLELALVLDRLGRREEAEAHLQAHRVRDRSASGRRRGSFAWAGRSPRSTRRAAPAPLSRRRPRWRRTTPAFPRPGASCSSTSTTRRKPPRLFADGAQGRPRWVPALVGCAARVADDDPRRRARQPSTRRSPSIRRRSTRTCCSRS